MEMNLNVSAPKRKRYYCDVYSDGERYLRLDENALKKLEFDVEKNQMLVAWVSKVVYIARRPDSSTLFGYRLTRTGKENSMAKTTATQIFKDTKLPFGEYEMVDPFEQKGAMWWGLKKKN